MQMISVNSTAISAIGYESGNGRLVIQFRKGHSYTFCGVPLHIYEGLMSSGSKGSYYSTYIRDRYHC